MMLNNMMAYSEVYEILNLLEVEYVEKVPEKVRNFFEEERLKEYKPQIKVDTPLTEQNLQRETIVLLAILNLNYWCETPEEKQEIINELTNNEQSQQELKEKYNPDNSFKNKRVNKKLDNSFAMIEYKKPNLIQKLLRKIKSLLKK